MTKRIKDEKWFREFVSKVCAHTESDPKVSYHDYFDACLKFVRIARSLQTIGENACNVPMNERQQKAQETRADNLEKQAAKLAAKIGLAGVETNGDPRGNPLFLKCKDGFYEDWGQRGISVPYRGQ